MREVVQHIKAFYFYVQSMKRCCTLVVDWLMISVLLLVSLKTQMLIKMSLFEQSLMRRSNQNFNILSPSGANPGHFTIFCARGVGNLTFACMRGVGKIEPGVSGFK